MRKITVQQSRKKRRRSRGDSAAGSRRPATRRKPKSAGGRLGSGRAGEPRAFLAGLAKFGGKEGCAAAVMIVEHAGGRVDKVVNTIKMPWGGAGTMRRPAGGGRAASRDSKGAWKVQGRVCQAFSTLGHVMRAKIVRKLLEGPATYQALKRLTKLKVGPLYHHVNQLRLAGMILPKQRDLYELTRGGRNLFLGALALAPLVKDGRTRALP